MIKKIDDFFKKRKEKLTNRHFENVGEAYIYRPRRWIANLITFGLILGLLIYFWLATGFGFNVDHNVNLGKRLGEVFGGFFVPNYEYLFGYGEYTFEGSVIFQTLTTFAIAFIGTLISSILSIPFGFLASRKITGRYAIITELILIVIRTFPEILFGFMLIKVSGFGAFTAMMVISIHSIGMIGKLYSEQLDVIDSGPLEALDACGANALVRTKIAVVPQIAPNFVSIALYRLDLNVRTAALLGLCAGDKGGIGYFVDSFAKNQHWPELGAILWAIIVMVLLVDFVSTWIRKKLV